ncbi:thiamine phosphate synthase [Zhouia amylolytica]|uniref:thiamine phosphate synthase n=1 Tax=Zhouia amylolytica TaxID=376730 RepID=UPI0020CF116C|nr:thiamine phosphate synthase [Zhouia amylolytica]MCQ0110926.1 thiamine phosphate synthase [Zhouia amylolytica]
MLIVITPENAMMSECRQLNEMFAAGLQYLHLRKPGYDEKQYIALLKGIEQEYLNKVVLHEHHHLCKSFGLKGVHLKEGFREGLTTQLPDYLLEFKREQFTVSTSFHDLSKLMQQNHWFDYALLSPVFNSISKEAYEGRGFRVKQLNGKVVGLGGISYDNMENLVDLGYHGAAVLGAIWQSEDPIAAFKNIKSKYSFQDV